MKIYSLASTVLILALTLAVSGCVSMTGKPKPPPELDDASRAQLNLATGLLMQNEPTRALEELLKVKGNNPQNPDVENLLGLAYYGMKEYPLAVESYMAALKLAPERTDVRNNLGLSYLAQRSYDLALAEFNACLTDLVYQKKQLPLSNSGLTYLEMGEYDKALAALTRATEVAPEYSKSYQLIGRVHMARNECAQALDYLNNAARLNPDDAETFMITGDAYVCVANKEEAAAAYSRVTTLVPNTNMAMEAQKRARDVMGF
ncbi:MAG: tetratricopeptide repeat protein [Candidatus Adiutrix sp.]|jgi:type IV pilus biogenesis/stability protein PilW|nr:tetratricopeptide repeat protein [Candidatus Adiutrix sp.]